MAEYLASIFGTEKDKVNCSFYFKIGACRHGDRCSRIHNKPTFSQTILLSNLYQNPSNAVQNPDGTQGAIPKISEAAVQEHFDNFFEDVFVELEEKYGEIEEMNVCDNLGDHLVGNVYIKFKNEEDAEKAVHDLNNRWFAGRPIYAELSPVTDFREACCLQYEMGECTRSGFCNFMHLKPISRDLRRYLYGKSSRGRSRSRSPHDRRKQYRSYSPDSRHSRHRRSSRDDRDHRSHRSRHRSRSREKSPSKRHRSEKSRSRERSDRRDREHRSRDKSKDREHRRDRDRDREHRKSSRDKDRKERRNRRSRSRSGDEGRSQDSIVKQTSADDEAMSESSRSPAPTRFHHRHEHENGQRPIKEEESYTPPGPPPQPVDLQEQQQYQEQCDYYNPNLLASDTIIKSEDEQSNDQTDNVNGLL